MSTTASTPRAKRATGTLTVYIGANVSPQNAHRVQKWGRRFGNKSLAVDAALTHAVAKGFPAKAGKLAGGAAATAHPARAHH